MTKAEFIKSLEGLPDTAQVLCPGSDHSYRPVSIEVTTALCYKLRARTIWTEDHGDEHSDPGFVRSQAVIIH